MSYFIGTLKSLPNPLQKCMGFSTERTASTNNHEKVDAKNGVTKALRTQFNPWKELPQFFWGPSKEAIASHQETKELGAEINQQNRDYADLENRNAQFPETFCTDIKFGQKKESPQKDTLNCFNSSLPGSSAKTPSETCFYQPLELFLQAYDIKKKAVEFFPKYEKLLLGHKVCLLPITDMAIKIALIAEIGGNKLSVRALKERILEL